MLARLAPIEVLGVFACESWTVAVLSQPEYRCHLLIIKAGWNVCVVSSVIEEESSRYPEREDDNHLTKGDVDWVDNSREMMQLLDAVGQEDGYHLTKGDVDWHYDSWDMMQVWDGLQHPAKKLFNPESSYKEARQNTPKYRDNDKLYLVRDEEVVNAFEETNEGYQKVENDLEFKEIETDGLGDLRQKDLAKMTEASRQSTGRTELRNETSRFERCRRYEEQMAEALDIPNYFQKKDIDTASGYTRSQVLKKLDEVIDDNEQSVSMNDLKDQGHRPLVEAASDLLGFNRAKEIVDLKTRKSNGYRKYPKPRNPDSFNEIKDPELAYWLGFLYADGATHKNSNRVEILQKKSQVETLRHFKQSLGIHNPIKEYESDSTRFPNGDYYDPEDWAVLGFSSEKVHSDLCDWGCGPDKSHSLEWPNDVETRPHDIPDSHLPDFVRGLFDGDGTVAIDNSESDEPHGLMWRVVGNTPVLEGVGELIEEELDIEFTEAKRRRTKDEESGGNRALHYGGNEQVPEIFDWMYQNVDSWDDPFMSRKLGTVVNLKPGYKNPEKHGQTLRTVQGKLENFFTQKEELKQSPEEIIERDEVQKF